MTAEQVVLLVELDRDLGSPAAGSWAAELERRGVVVFEDDLGRPAVDRAVARALFAEHREAEARNARRLQELERQAIAADAARRAQIPPGIPLDAVPVGVSPGEWLMRSDPMVGARRRSVVEDALEHGGSVIYSLNEGAP
jgi:hypothetical protein